MDADLAGMQSAVTDEEGGCSLRGPQQFGQTWLYLLIQEIDTLLK